MSQPSPPPGTGVVSEAGEYPQKESGEEKSQKQEKKEEQKQQQQGPNIGEIVSRAKVRIEEVTYKYISGFKVVVNVKLSGVGIAPALQVCYVDGPTDSVKVNGNEVKRGSCTIVGVSNFVGETEATFTVEAPAGGTFVFRIDAGYYVGVFVATDSTSLRIRFGSPVGIVKAAFEPHGTSAYLDVVIATVPGIEPGVRLCYLSGLAASIIVASNPLPKGSCAVMKPTAVSNLIRARIPVMFPTFGTYVLRLDAGHFEGSRFVVDDSETLTYVAVIPSGAIMLAGIAIAGGAAYLAYKYLAPRLSLEELRGAVERIKARAAARMRR